MGAWRVVCGVCVRVTVLTGFLGAARYIVFALQVVEHGKVVDYSAANHYLKKIMDHPSSEWEDLKAAFQKPVFFKLRDEFFNKARYHELYSRMDVEAEVHAHLFNPRDKAAFLASDIGKLNHLATTGSTPPDESSADPSGLLETVRYLREHGVQQLRQRYHLRVLPHSQHANIVHLAPTVRSLPLPLPCSQQFCALRKVR